MPTTIDALEYDNFTYDQPSERSLTLDEAIKKATELRRGDAANFYRVKSADSTGTEFKVEKVSLASVYADFLLRFAQRWGRNARLRK